MTSPDLKQLRDLVREMRSSIRELTHGITAEVHLQALANSGIFERANRCIARADALIGPGDGFQEVERLNREMSDE